ncbi:DNA topoisomerase IV subunit A [archaeon]|nr:DNA topoisomerase IV subunit A [archaeon]
MSKRNKKLLENLENIGNKVIKDFEKNKNPTIKIPSRTLSNVYFDEKKGMLALGDKMIDRNYFNLSQAKKFMQTLLIASKLKEVLQKGNTVGLRQLFYMSKHTLEGLEENTFDNQDESDPVVEDIEGLLDALREELGIFAATKGKMAGPLKIRDKGDLINTSKLGSSGYGIPSIVEDHAIQLEDHDAKFILVIEKEQMWNRLNEDKFWKKHNCIILTGKGQPARGDRRMVRRLHEELKLPVYVFTDMDIWGYYIYSVYKQGSINLAHFSTKAAVPDAKFLGFKTSDIKRFDIPKEHWIKMNKGDLKRIREIKDYDWFKNDKKWQKEFKALVKFGHKIEQDALVAKGIEFTSKDYLPVKIKEKDWID